MSPVKISVALVLFFCLGAVFAGGVDPGVPDVSSSEENTEKPVLNNFQVEERADRHRRVTCDLLSFGGKVNHSACAAHCLARGKAGGRCNNGICQCRNRSFKDLFG